MFNSIRYFGMTFGMVVATTVGVGVAAADPKKVDVMLKNDLEFAAEVKSNLFSSEYQSVPGDPKRIGSIDDGKTFTWTATPKRDEDKAKFASCSGSKTIKGPAPNTVTMTRGQCKAASVSTAPKNNTPNNQAPKTGSARPTVDFVFENDSKYRVELVTTDNKAPSPSTGTTELASGEIKKYEVYKDQDGSIDFFAVTRCQSPDSPYRSADQAVYKHVVSGHIFIKDLGKDTGSCRLPH